MHYLPVVAHTGSMFPYNLLPNFFISISTRNDHTHALTRLGAVFSWGNNYYAQSGTGSISAMITSPVPVTCGSVMNKVIMIVAGDHHTLVLNKNGNVFAWGLDSSYQTGNNRNDYDYAFNSIRYYSGYTCPVPTYNNNMQLGNITTIAAGSTHSLAISSDNILYGWGDNSQGQLGMQDTTTRKYPTPVTLTAQMYGKIFTAVAAGDQFSLVLCSDGSIFGMGIGSNGQIGDGLLGGSARISPVIVTLATQNIVAISAGSNFAAALDSIGTVYTWGDNDYYQLGNSGPSKAIMTTVNNIPGTVIAISAGSKGIHCLTSNNQVFGWGDNSLGDVGILNTSTLIYVPTQVYASGVMSDANITAIAYRLAIASAYTCIPSCFGTIATNSSTCSGNGTCTGTDSCACNPGWQGSDCEIPYCNGIIFNSTSVCSGRGVCLGGNVCACNTGYYGDTCQLYNCSGVPYNSYSVCSGRGTCSAPEVCSNCVSPYFGHNCEAFSCCKYCINVFTDHLTDGKNNTDPTACNGHGVCVAPNNCICANGYNSTNIYNADCRYAWCYGSSQYNVCSGKGDCVSPDNCSCYAGYSGYLCTKYSCYK
jgi:alpha-tubulin suppressor-like RCC1 family protein